jgi:uncharacterized protein (TIGR00251 family)
MYASGVFQRRVDLPSCNSSLILHPSSFVFNLCNRRNLRIMIDYSEKAGALTFKVQVVPRASRSEIVGEHNGALKVRLAAPPVDGAANEELIRTLAHALGMKRGAVEIIGGHTSKTKQVRVTGASPRDLELAAKSRRGQAPLPDCS